MNDEQRRNPDRLLAAILDEELQATRGKLKIFFGACAGVGKTWAMLSAARQRLAEGVDVVVGVVETHGRQETVRLTENLPTLPLREVNYRGRVLTEFDIDAALARAPQLMIVDELAHSNLEGSRHAKRWQDVEELLAKGIDVYTALNVQHLQTLGDVVGSITGIVVRETVPDRFFDQANDVTLVDLPPDELLERLQDGKVYVAEAAQRAANNFFRKGNLIALRELALRRTADRVDSQMRAYRADRAIANVWHARERLLLCIGPGPGGDKLVRSAARLANDLKADWIAVYVETPAIKRLSKAARQRVLDCLQLAGELGAETTTLASSDLIATLTSYARSRNANKLLVGRPLDLPWYLRWKPRFVDALTRQASDIDVVVIGLASDTNQSALPFDAPQPLRWSAYALATLACALTTGLAQGLLSLFNLSNVVMLFLVTVVGVSIRLGRGPGAWAAAVSVLMFDFFLVPPRFSFAVSDVQYLFTFGIMLMVSLGIGQMAAKLRFEARVANLRERRAQALATLSRELSAALTFEQVVEIANRHVAGVFNAACATLLPDSHEKICIAGDSATLDAIDEAVAQWVYDHQRPAGRGTGTLAASTAHYLPLKAPMRTRGVLAIAASDLQYLDEPEQKRLLDTFAAQVALALERVHYVEVAQDALVSMEGERLRNGLLSAISHDLRTPLTAMVGLASTLAEREPPEPVRRELAMAIQTEAQQMCELVTNLLDMARLQSGAIHLKKDWQSLEEIVGSVLAQMKRTLQGHRLRVVIPASLPLLECDPVLIQRVLVNLLDNAVKYTEKGGEIAILALHDPHEPSRLQIVVEDNGPGLPAGQEVRLFDKFARGEVESNKPGVGLGLALCKLIVEVHGGRISAQNRAEGGARFCLWLPLDMKKNDEFAENTDH
jgi:two-component system sensor histidine kinase KdpD